jgi:hypothetical protein
MVFIGFSFWTPRQNVERWGRFPQHSYNVPGMRLGGKWHPASVSPLIGGGDPTKAPVFPDAAAVG